MAKYNKSFELDIDDLDLIETALQSVVARKSDAPIDPRDAHELLGRLHNQKIFYRPNEGVYISG